MKKLLALLLAGIMVFSLVACGEEAAEEPKKEETKTEATTDAVDDAKADVTEDAEKTVEENAPESKTETQVYEEDAEDAESAVVGEWVAKEFNSPEIAELSDEEKAELDKMLEGFTISFDSDGTGVMAMDGEEETFEWTVDGTTVSLTNNGDTIEAELEGGRLVITDEGVDMVFVKKISA